MITMRNLAKWHIWLGWLVGVPIAMWLATGLFMVARPIEDARALVATRIIGGDKIARVTLFPADKVPFDFRRPLAVWQVALEDGTNVYVGRDTGDIEAVRTRWWRAFDFAWGLHIMDLSEREDTSHPVLIIFAALSLTGALIGCVLMFRRRRARVAAL